MPATTQKKTAIANMRLTPQSKAALKDIGEREGRSMANTIEWLVAEYFRTRDLPIPEHKPKTRAAKAPMKGKQ